jgi:predicted NBD/HSP70 family sugar kinase
MQHYVGLDLSVKDTSVCIVDKAGKQTRATVPSRDAPDFVEVGEAGIAMDDAMRRQRCLQLLG